MNNPFFVDLNACTARIDPQRGATGYIKLSIFTEQAYDESGNVAHRGQVAEIYIKPEQADALADALRNARAP